ncbi:hypothetical protein BC827DRAFT_49058 [Russula dissimulans]|nr:hypothetical protein BC827DRAFT_49058 [Russula dissimulans]
MSDSSSPPRKRQRMSSPTYDDQLALPSQEELRAIGQIEFGLSQASSHYYKRTNKVPTTGRSSQDCLGLENLHHLSDSSDLSACPASSPRQHPAVQQDDPDDPFTSTSGPFPGFISAVSLSRNTKPTLPSDPGMGQREGDIDGEREGDPNTSNLAFTSASDIVASPMGFISASTLPGKPVTSIRDGSPPSHRGEFGDYAQAQTDLDSSSRVPNVANQKPFSTFTSLGKQKILFQPSSAAMKAALEREKRWATEDSDLFLDRPDDLSGKTTDVPPRQALLDVVNVSPQGTRASVTASVSTNQGLVASSHVSAVHNVMGPPSGTHVEVGETFRSAAHFSTPTALKSHSFHTPFASGIERNSSTKPFRSPFLNTSATTNSGNPQHMSSRFNTTASTPTRGPKSSVLDTSFPAAVIASTAIPIGGTPVRKGSTKKFVTPFKPGMRPGEAGHSQLKARHDAERVSAAASRRNTEDASSINDGSRKPTRRRFFDLSSVKARKTLALSGFQPGKHGSDALTNLGINVAELRDLSPNSALQHRFYVSSEGIPSTDPAPRHLRGPTDALRELKSLGCHLATQEWVDNHWPLILWKLAGTVALDPESEIDNNRQRWSWAETMRQLQYRYEKELNRGARPALRLVTAQDASARLHMVLCVSDITWSRSGMGDDGLPLVPHPTLELTDGWYRLRAQVDEVLARAARRGVIRVGRKIAVSGASLPRNAEPCEVLEAYDKVELNIAGNGTHLAPWHTKLGFQPHPAIATLHTLSPDGGVVPCLQLVVTKVYPVAFIEFRKDADGRITREGPRREKEELAVQDAWARKREHEYHRLRKESEDKQNLFLDWAQRFEVKYSDSWHANDDEDMPGHIESMFDECEYASDPSSVLRRANRAEAGWLARFARGRAEEEHEAMEKGFERELQAACPPREVRSFRVLLMRDACATRRPARRMVELTVWDVLQLGLDGTPEGHFKEGQSFQVTNLLPTQKNAWMDRGVEGAHVYLSTSKTSRWNKSSLER